MTDHQQLALFHRTLAGLCRSEMPLGRAFASLASDLERGPLKDAVAAMAADVEAGTPLAEAYRKHAKVFPPLYAGLVEAGTVSGDLPGTLEEIARHARMQDEARTRVRRALAYPVIASLAVLLVWGFLATFVVPKFGEMFSTMTDKRGRPLSLPSITLFTLGVSSIVSRYWPLLLVAGAAAWWGGRRFLETPGGAALHDRVATILPLLPRVGFHSSMVAFTGSVGVLLRRGVPLDRAFELAGSGAENPSVRRGAFRMAEKVRGGAGASAAAREGGIFSPSVVWLIEAGERGGTLAEAFEDITGLHHDRVDRSTDAVVWVAVPALNVVMGFVVAVMILAVFWPILEMQKALM